MERSQVPAGFDAGAASYDRLVGMNPGYHTALRRSVDRLWADRSWTASTSSRPAAVRLLDLGCGTGASTAALLRRFPDAAITAADASEQMVAIARGKRWPKTVQLRHISAEDLIAEQPAGGFDAIFASYLLRNLADPDAALTGMYRLLRPGGMLVLHEYSVRDSPAAVLVWRAVCAGIIIPAGRAATGDAALFRHLRDSVLGFDGITDLRQRLRHAGFSDVTSGTVGGWQHGIVHTVLGRRS